MIHRTHAALLTVVTAALVVAAAAPVAAVDEDAVDRAREVLAGRMADLGVPGAAFVVTDADGGSAAQGLGRTGAGGPVTAETPFVIGSTTKSFTALAVMQLVDDGLVDLAAPVSRYVPELDLAGGAAGTITVRDLLQQTSGLSDAAAGPVLASATEGTTREAVEELRGVQPAAAPGERWEYANANFVLAGLVVERASGRTYAEHVQARIFDPLGMTRSSTGIERASANGVTAGHQIWFGATVARGPVVREGVLAAGYLVSTAEDMGAYLRMYLRGGLADDGTRVVSAEALATMTAPGPQAHLGPWADGAPARYAMGWFVGGPWEETAVFHPGNTPDSSAMITLLPDRGTAVATLTNLSHETPVPGNPSATDRLTRNVVDAVLGEPVDPGPTVRSFVLWFDAIVLLLLAAATWGLVRAVRAALRRTPPGHRGRAAVGVAVRALAAVLLLLAPGATPYGWAGLWTWAPDLALVLAALAGLLLATAAVRGLAWSSRGQPADQSPTTAASTGRRSTPNRLTEPVTTSPDTGSA